MESQTHGRGTQAELRVAVTASQGKWASVEEAPWLWVSELRKGEGPHVGAVRGSGLAGAGGWG